MYFRKPHPWDAGYALPDYVLAEPENTALTTAYRARKSIDVAKGPPPWNPGYAVPNYVDKEPVGQGTFTTKYTPRRTVDTLIPQYLSGDDALDADPIVAFGQQAAAHILSSIRSLPVSSRKQALRALFDELDPKLWSRVEQKATELQAKQKLSAKAAMHKAVADSLSIGLLEQIVNLGKGKAPETRSILGLATYGAPAKAAVLEGLSLCGPTCMLGQVTGAVSKATSWAGTAINKVTNLACTAISSPLGQKAAAAGASAAGAGPYAGAQGAQMAAGMCAQPVAQMPAPQSSIPWIPIAIGGVALIGILIATR